MDYDPEKVYKEKLLEKNENNNEPIDLISQDVSQHDKLSQIKENVVVRENIETDKANVNEIIKTLSQENSDFEKISKTRKNVE